MNTDKNKGSNLGGPDKGHINRIRIEANAPTSRILAGALEEAAQQIGKIFYERWGITIGWGEEVHERDEKITDGLSPYAWKGRKILFPNKY